MKVFHGKFYRYILKALRYTLLFVCKRQIVKDMIANGFILDNTITVKQLYRFWFVDNTERYAELDDQETWDDDDDNVRTVVRADSSLLQ